MSAQCATGRIAILGVGTAGLLVEPQPDLAEQLRRARRAKVYAVAWSTPENGGKTLTLYVAGIQSTLDADFYVAGVRRTGSVEVPIMTLDQVLEDAGAPQPLDFVSIDVEGHDVEVLAGFDLAGWRPRLPLIEDVVQSLDLHRHLVARGYRWMRQTGINSWYVPAEAPFRLDLKGRAQCVRKCYLGPAVPHAAREETAAAPAVTARNFTNRASARLPRSERRFAALRRCARACSGSCASASLAVPRSPSAAA